MLGRVDKRGETDDNRPMQVKPALRWLLLLLVTLGICLTLAACDDTTPAPKPSAPQETSVAIQVPTITEAATGTAPVASPQPAVSPAPSPTHTTSPAPTPTPLPSVTPTLTPTVSAALAPITQPHHEIDAALHEQYNGNYEQAIAMLQAVLDAGPQPDQERLARFHLAETFMHKRDWPAAAAVWEDYFRIWAEDDALPQARMMAARVLDETNQCSAAIPHYQAYVAGSAVLADMIHERIGDCQSSYGEVESAIASYRLVEYLQEQQIDDVVAMDMAIQDVVQFLSAGEINPVEIFGYEDRNNVDGAFAIRVREQLDNPDAVYVFHVNYVQFRNRWETFQEIVAQEGRQWVETQIIYDWSAMPVFRIVRVVS